MNYDSEYAVNSNSGFSTVPLSATSNAIVLPFTWTALVKPVAFVSCSFCIGPKSARNSRDLEKSKGATGFNVPIKE